MSGCPVYGGLAAYGGNRGRDGGRVGGPPFLPLRFPCPVGAARDECCGARLRPARCAFLFFFFSPVGAAGDRRPR